MPLRKRWHDGCRCSLEYQNIAASSIAAATQYQLLTDFDMEPGTVSGRLSGDSRTITMWLSAWNTSTSVETTIATMDIAGSALDALVIGGIAAFTTYSLPATLPDPSLVGQQLRVYFKSVTSNTSKWSLVRRQRADSV